MKPFDLPFTAFHNYVLDHIMPDLSPNAWKILCVAIRQTIGWQDETTESKRKEKDIISFSQFREKAGIASNETVNRAIIECTEKQYLIREIVGKYRGKPSYAYHLNTEYEATITETVKVEQVTITETVKEKLPTVTETVNTKERRKKESKKIPTDYLLHCSDIEANQQKERQWTVPPNAGGSDSFTDGPVDAFCNVLAEIPLDRLPPKKRKQWAGKLRQIAEENSMEGNIVTAEDMTQAILAVPDSRLSFKTYSSPFSGNFDKDIALLLLRDDQLKALDVGY